MGIFSTIHVCLESRLLLKFQSLDRRLMMTKPPPTMNTYTWTINKLSTVTKERLRSDVFKVGKVKWTLLLYPKGNKCGSTPCEGTHLSIYLGVHDVASLPDNWKVYTAFKLRLKSHGTESDIEKETKHWLCNSVVDWGRMIILRLKLRFQ
ncbi:putative ubiquitinyl hydrolase 1 [Helianthus debilis subsp. tardiflorus]